MTRRFERYRAVDAYLKTAPHAFIVRYIYVVRCAVVCDTEEHHFLLQAVTCLNLESTIVFELNYTKRESEQPEIRGWQQVQ